MALWVFWEKTMYLQQKNQRQLKMEREIRYWVSKVLPGIIQWDPSLRYQRISIQSIKLTADLKKAKIFVTLLGDLTFFPKTISSAEEVGHGKDSSRAGSDHSAELTTVFSTSSPAGGAYKEEAESLPKVILALNKLSSKIRHRIAVDAGFRFTPSLLFCDGTRVREEFPPLFPEKQP